MPEGISLAEGVQRLLGPATPPKAATTPPPREKREREQDDTPQPEEQQLDEAEATGEDADTPREPPELNDGDEPAPAEGDEEAPTPDDDEPDAAEAEPTFTVTINGKEETVTRKELLAGYQRQRDYTQKTAQIAEERRTVQAVRTALTQERGKMHELLSVFEAQLQPPKIDWEKLRQTNPADYLLRKEMERENNERLTSIRQARAALIRQEEQQREQALNEHIARERALLPERIPEWRNPVVAKRERPLLVEYLRKAEFTDDEIHRSTDSRSISIVRKAWLWDQQQAAKARKTPTPPAKTVKVVAPSKPGSRVEGPRRREQEALSRLKKSGKLQDGVDVLLARSKR